MGGIETHVYEVGRRLVHNGVDVTLLTTIPQSLTTSLPKEEEIEGVRIIRVRAWPQKRDYYIAPEIYSIIQRGQWDMVHCQGCHTFVPPLAMYAAQAAKIPYLVTFHTGGHSSRLRTSIRGIQWRLQRPLMANAAKLIGVSHFEANYFQQVLHLPAQRFSVIPNGATLPSVPQGAVKASTYPLIVSVGRLERHKGHQRLITALPKIREQRPAARLLIVGAGPYENTLRALAHTVGVAGYVEIRAVPASDRQGMAELLSQATVVALLSEYEAHPIAVMEALALQRPVLVTNTSGLREIAEQGFARAIALESTAEEVARAVLQQIEDPLVPPAYLALPTWDDCAGQLQSMYTQSSRRILCAS
jgi:glycosyltransferase involved in cell wall biosynthesis